MTTLILIQGSQDCEERFRQCEKISLKETVAEKAEEVQLLVAW